MPFRLFFILILFLPFLTACVTDWRGEEQISVHTPGIEPAGAPSILFVPPLSDSAQEKTLSHLIEQGQPAEQDGIRMTQPYMSAGGNLCAVLSSQHSTESWLACRAKNNQWTVKPALLREDAIYGIQQ